MNRHEVMAVLDRLLVGIAGESSKTCDWYEGILYDAMDEAYLILSKLEKETDNGIRTAGL